MEYTAFQLLGIENKELPISNLLAYYLDPIRNHKYGFYFLNEFCKIAGINGVTIEDKIVVQREAYFPYDGDNNYIDILISVGESHEKPERIICIENKINSTEGITQTQRYYNALEAKFKDCKKRDYIYLTKNNSSVNLTSHHFKHIRYSEVGNLLADKRFIEMPLAQDFYNYYVLREQSLFMDIEKYDRPYIPGDKADFHTLIDYIVWKINVRDINRKYTDLFCLHGKSAQSDEHFYQVSMQNWEFEFDGKTEKHPISIHLEGNCKEVPLHMELKPYEPFRKIKEKYGSDFFSEYMKVRDELRNNIVFPDAKEYRSVPIRSNADLTIAKFVFNVKTYKEYFDALIELITYVNEVLENSNVSL